MYESPIDIIYSEMQTKLEGKVFKAVQNVGINVNKDELIKALSYDRQQYEKGYADAKAEQQWIPVTERLPEANEKDENGFTKAYLVQDARWMDVARWDGKFWIAWGYGTVLKNVTAWMPLPEPYRAERRTDEKKDI